MVKKDLFWFFTKSEYEDAKDELSIPYVAYIKATDEVIYKQEEDVFLKAWVDDFPEGLDYDNTKEEFVEDPEGLGCNPYVFTGDTLTIDGTTYYEWEFERSSPIWHGSVAYMLTTSCNYNTLYSQSMENDLDNTFDAFFAQLTEDELIYNQNVGDSTDQKLVKIEKVNPISSPLRIWIDMFKEGVDYDKTKEEFIETPERFGSHSYICQGETIEFEGETYYLWEFDSSVGTDSDSSPYLLTTSYNYTTLYSESMEDDLNNTFDSYVGMLDSNDELYRVHNDSDKDQMLLKVEYL